MPNYRFGDQVTVVSPTSRHRGQNGIYFAPTSNRKIVSVMFADGSKVNLMLSSIRPKQDVQEIHFYPKTPSFVPCLLTDSFNTQRALDTNQPVIRTTQMDFLSTALYLNGYRIFLHLDDVNVTELRVGDKFCSHKQILPSDDLYQLWKQESSKGHL